MKDYYFNAMYKYKYTYRDIYLLKFNFLRKITFILRKSQIRYLFSIILFILKILLYFYIQFELIFLYFYRIHIFIYYFLKIKFFKKEIIKSFRMQIYLIITSFDLKTIHESVIKQAFNFAHLKKFQQPETWFLQFIKMSGHFAPCKVKFDIKPEIFDEEKIAEPNQLVH